MFNTKFNQDMQELIFKSNANSINVLLTFCKPLTSPIIINPFLRIPVSSSKQRKSSSAKPVAVTTPKTQFSMQVR